MGEWVIVILLACVSSNGISENKEVGFGINPKGEIIIISPPVLDVHLKPKKRIHDVLLMADDNDHLYAVKTSVIEGKFIFFVNELESVKNKLDGHSGWIEFDSYRSLKSTVITTVDPQANQIMDTALAAVDVP